jgi:hypothetical protein
LLIRFVCAGKVLKRMTPSPRLLQTLDAALPAARSPRQARTRKHKEKKENFCSLGTQRFAFNCVV